MAGHATEKPKFSEKGSEALRNIHWALGGAALALSVVAAPVVAAGLTAFGAWQGVHGAAWEGARRHFVKRRQTKNHH